MYCSPPCLRPSYLRSSCLRLSALAAWLCFAFVALAVDTAPADERVLGQFTDWEAMTYREDGGLVCSMWSAPIDATGIDRDRPAHAYVAHRVGVPGKIPASYHTVTLEFGAALKSGRAVKGKVGSQRFELYADDNWAWNRFRKEDRRLVRAMRAGATLIVSATTVDDEPISYTYSLSGFTAAHKAIGKACDVN